MRGLSLCLVPLLASGCFLDRAALDGEADAGQPGFDAATGDAGRDALVPPIDVGPEDASQCIPTGGVELCDGVDNDCMRATPDGVDDPMRGQPCDADGDRCNEGVFACEGGMFVCVDDGVDPPELCNGIDDDCDPSTVDGSDDPALGMACDGASDTDLCQEGETVCKDGSVECDEEADDATESCNRMDDDCNGIIDDRTGCTCRGFAFGGHAYLFCDETVTDWSAARAACPAGYDLAIITSVEEQTFVGETADSIDNGNFWLGATRDMPPSPDGTTFTWLDGTRVPLSTDSGGGFQNWHTGQPDTTAEDCLEMDADMNSPAGVRGRWNDRGCDSDNRYVCESL